MPASPPGADCLAPPNPTPRDPSPAPVEPVQVAPPDRRGAPAPAARATRAVKAWLDALKPVATTVDRKERWRAFLGAGLGILVAGLACRALATDATLPWLVAPLGASAVLVFAVPSSPLAQPWAVLGGNTLSALVGIACVRLVPDPALAAALAVGLAIAMMFTLRCLHPPGGATALWMVMSHTGAWQAALDPVLANSLLLVLVGMLYNSLTGRPYPHRTAPRPATTPAGSRFSDADLDAALARYNQVLDVSRDDLQTLLHHAEASAYSRKLGDLRCADVMTHAPLAVAFGTSLDEAWALMRRTGIKALPVIDRVRRIVGIVTLADFLKHVDLDRREGLAQRLRAFVASVGTVHADKPEAVGQIMTRRVRVASASRPLIELIPMFSEGGHHHVPIIDDEQRLVGIITQSDLVKALHRAVAPGP